MSRLCAYFGNEPERLACALFPARDALHAMLGGPHAFGLGFVQGGDVLLQKRPRSAGAEVDFFSQAKDLRADALVGRIATGDEAGAPAEDTDPFRFRSWLFGSLGRVLGFEGVRDKLLESVPDYLRRNIRGRSASEHLFHLFLTFLHDGGLLEQQSPPPDAVRNALHASVALLDRLLAGGGGESTRLALVATNGRCLVAAGRRHPIHYLQIAGIADCPVCRGRADRDNDSRRISHDSLRGVVIEADGTAARSGWQTVPQERTLVVGSDRSPLLA